MLALLNSKFVEYSYSFSAVIQNFLLVHYYKALLLAIPMTNNTMKMMLLRENALSTLEKQYRCTLGSKVDLMYNTELGSSQFNRKK